MLSMPNVLIGLYFERDMENALKLHRSGMDSMGVLVTDMGSR